MKKYVLAILCAAMAVSMATGCSKKEKPAETSAETQTEAATEAATEAEIDKGTVTKLGEYKGLSLTKPSVEVTDEELETKIQSILDANPEYVEVERPAAEGDTVNIDYVGMKDGVAFDGGTAEGYDLALGSGSFIDGFEDGLIGAKKGDELSLNLKFPEGYPKEDLAGQEVVFDVTVNDVKEKHDAVLDDAFVKKMSEFSTVDEFKEDLRNDLKAANEAQAEQLMQDNALQAVLDASELDVNAEAVEAQFNTQKNYYAQMSSMYGMDLQEYIKLFGMEEAEFDEELRKGAENIVKQQLVIDAISEAEKMEVTDEDRQYVADQVGMDLATLKESYGEALDTSALSYKVINFLVENAKVE